MSSKVSKKRQNEFLQYCAQVVAYLRYMLFLTPHNVTISLSDKDTKTVSGGTASASINCDTSYLNNNMIIHTDMLNEWENKRYSNIAAVLLHEVTHILLEPLSELSRNNVRPSEEEFVESILEQTTQRISRGFDSCLPAGWYQPEFLNDWARDATALCFKACKRNKR